MSEHNLLIETNKEISEKYTTFLYLQMTAICTINTHFNGSSNKKITEFIKIQNIRLPI